MQPEPAPLDPPGACQLALGAVCAEYQGKFAAYHDRVFAAEGLSHPGTEDVVRLAGEAGLNADAMRGCLEDPTGRAPTSAPRSRRRSGWRSRPPPPCT